MPWYGNSTIRMSDQPETRTETSTEGHAYEAVLIYTDAAGHKWYTFKEPLKMPPGRAVAGELAAEWANLNITPEDWDAFFAKMEEHSNKGQIVDLMVTLRTMHERRKWAFDGRALLELAKVYFLIDDEPMGWQTDKFDKLKEERWATDTPCKGFFLLRAYTLTKGFTEFSESDILGYLRAQEVLAMRNVTAPPSQPAPKSDSGVSRKFFKRKPTTSTSKPSLSAGKSPAK